MFRTLLGRGTWASPDLLDLWKNIDEKQTNKDFLFLCFYLNNCEKALRGLRAAEGEQCYWEQRLQHSREVIG